MLISLSVLQLAAVCLIAPPGAATPAQASPGNAEDAQLTWSWSTDLSTRIYRGTAGSATKPAIGDKPAGDLLVDVLVEGEFLFRWISKGSEADLVLEKVATMEKSKGEMLSANVTSRTELMSKMPDGRAASLTYEQASPRAQAMMRASFGPPYARAKLAADGSIATVSMVAPVEALKSPGLPDNMATLSLPFLRFDPAQESCKATLQLQGLKLIMRSTPPPPFAFEYPIVMTAGARDGDVISVTIKGKIDLADVGLHGASGKLKDFTSRLEGTGKWSLSRRQWTDFRYVRRDAATLVAKNGDLNDLRVVESTILQSKRAAP